MVALCQRNPGAAIISATSLAAESLNLGDKIGAIAPGMEADIIAVERDPLKDITSLRRVAFVMKGGKICKGEPAGGKSREIRYKCPCPLFLSDAGNSSCGRAPATGPLLTVRNASDQIAFIKS